MTETILVAINDSAAAFEAARVAVGLALRLQARVRAVSVVAPGSPPDAGGGHTPALELAARAALHHVDALGKSTGVHVVGVLRLGNVAAEILEDALECEATLIVMARVGRPGHALPHLGSTTQHVLEFSTVPVLVVPGRH